jgi:hypothetical protein
MSIKMENWVRVDVFLQQKMQELIQLDKERELLISKAEKEGKITPELEKELNKSLEKYTKLADEISSLKKRIKEKN